MNVDKIKLTHSITHPSGIREAIFVSKYEKRTGLKRKARLQHTDYYKEVWRITELNAVNLPDNHKRGKEFALDHKIPIIYGYRKGIEPSIIGGIDNIRIITKQDNLLKNRSYRFVTKENSGIVASNGTINGPHEPKI